MRKSIIAGNWKMNKTVAEAAVLVSDLKKMVEDLLGQVDVVVIPPYTALLEVCIVLKGSNIVVGAQNMFWEESGAYTGEISAEMIKSTGAEYVIIGHSERRQLFAETNEIVNKKLKAALSVGLLPIVCVGETLKQRKQNITQEVVETQLRGAFQDILKNSYKNIIIAYEPVWAIGTGLNATPEQAEEVHQFIRKLLQELATDELASKMRIQYGGSVKPDNARDLLGQPDVDGALVGGASLDATSFVEIIKAAL